MSHDRSLRSALFALSLVLGACTTFPNGYHGLEMQRATAEKAIGNIAQMARGQGLLGAENPGAGSGGELYLNKKGPYGGLGSIHFTARDEGLLYEVSFEDDFRTPMPDPKRAQYKKDMEDDLLKIATQLARSGSGTN